MIGRWYEVFGHRHAPPAALGVSIAAHVLLLGAFAERSGPKAILAAEPTFRPVFYLPPPNRDLAAATGERLEWVALGSGSGGTASESTAPAQSDARLIATAQSVSAGDGEPSPEPGTTANDEPVYSVVEVHEEAARVASSAAPAYPRQLLTEGVEGTVLVQYVVGVDGTADVSSFRVISASRREFADAVREALPHMRFTPARIDDRPVRQLVEQPFIFRIRKPAADSTLQETARAP